MSTANPIFYSRHDGGVTLYVDNKPYTVSSTNANFDRLLKALKDKEWAKAKSLMNLGDTITAMGKSKNRKLKDYAVYVKDGKVFLKSPKGDEELHGTITERIVKVMGKPQGDKFADALLMFMHNAMQNPYKDIREELYDFLKAGDQPITYDGCFLAYKRVRPDYKSIHGGVVDNSPGKIVREEKFDTNRLAECSAGLHFAAFGYLSHFSDVTNSRTVIVKVNPKDVVAIPKDYHFQKGRTREYYVVGEFKPGVEIKEAFKDTFVDEMTKSSAAPSIDFIKTGLRPGLEARADAAGLLVKDSSFTKGAVYVVYDTKGNTVPVIRKSGKNGGLFDLAGDEWILEPGCKAELKSILTASVRDAVKKALDKAKL